TWNHTISAMPLGGGSVTILASTFRPSGVAVDAGFVYWTDSVDNVVRRAPLAGGATDTLTTATAPSGIAVDPTSIYFGVDGSIKRLPLAGGPATDVITGIGKPAQLAIDHDRGLLYWSEAQSHYVQRMALDGTGRRNIAENDS